MVSPANTYVGLTHTGPGTAPGEPDKYYPTGKRNYARVVAADDFQGAADAQLAKQLGMKKVYVLNDKEAYGLGVAPTSATRRRSSASGSPASTAWDGRRHRTRRSRQDQAAGARRRLPRRPDLRERRQADQGQGRRSSAEQRTSSSSRRTASRRSRPRCRAPVRRRGPCTCRSPALAERAARPAGTDVRQGLRTRRSRATRSIRTRPTPLRRRRSS